MDSDSDTSSLSSAASEKELKKLAPIFMKAKRATKLVAPPPVVSPPRPKRPPSPPHEEVLADNSDIAFLVMFRSRFQEAFTKVAHFGPQDIEFGIVDSVPSPLVEDLLRALLALVMNRKKPIEKGHHGRALEDAITSHKPQWPPQWAAQNPLSGGKDFRTMTPSERLTLLRTLALWALSSSEAISAILKDRYKQNRHNDDENQPLSVQPWGMDGDKRRYFLIQGLDDTGFRVYREGGRYTKNAHWWSVAGSIDEVKALAEKLDKVDGSQAARRLSVKMLNAVPMFEATEEKRRRREYRQQRRAAFSRPEPGFGIYEGRTRGKRMRYTYDEEDGEEDSDATDTMRSTRHSGQSTPFENGPTVTASGRQVRPTRGGDYGESRLGGNVAYADDVEDYAAMDEDSDHEGRGGRPRRAARDLANGHSQKRKRTVGDDSDDEMSDKGGDSAGEDEWNSEGNEEEDDDMVEDSKIDEDELDDGPIESSKLVVKLRMPAHTNGVKTETPPTDQTMQTNGLPKSEALVKPEIATDHVKDSADTTVLKPEDTADIVGKTSSEANVASSALVNGTEYPTPASQPMSAGA